MAVQFPDPNDATEYEYTSPDGCVANYTWDGVKWVIPCSTHTTNFLRARVEDLEVEVENIVEDLNA